MVFLLFPLTHLKKGHPYLCTLGGRSLSEWSATPAVALFMGYSQGCTPHIMKLCEGEREGKGRKGKGRRLYPNLLPCRSEDTYFVRPSRNMTVCPRPSGTHVR